MNNTLENSTIIHIESWFIPLDIIIIIIAALSIILGIIFLLIAATHRTCWTVPMLLSCDSCLEEITFSSILLLMATFSIQHDLQANIGDASYCKILGMISYAGATGQNYSFLLMALYRYIRVVYPTRLYWQSMRCQLSLVIVKWIFSFGVGLSMYLTDQIVYNINNQICQIPLSLSAVMIYETIILYMIPNAGIFGIYMQLTCYIRRISARTTVANNLFHARRELRLIQRTIVLSCTLITLGIPYITFMLISFVTTPPKYHFRIALVGIQIAVLIIIIMMYSFTQPIKNFIRKPTTISIAVLPRRYITTTFS